MCKARAYLTLLSLLPPRQHHATYSPERRNVPRLSARFFGIQPQLYAAPRPCAPTAQRKTDTLQGRPPVICDAVPFFLNTQQPPLYPTSPLPWLQLLPSLMQQLAAQNPQLVQLINANQEDFYHLINTPPGPMPGMGGPGAPGGGQAIQVTPEENADIERLTEMGFDRAIAAQVCCKTLWRERWAHFCVRQ